MDLMKNMKWLFCFTLFQIITIVALIAAIVIDSKTYTVSLQILSIIACILSYAALFMLFIRILQKAQLEADNEILENQIALQKEHYVALQESQKQMQEIKAELLEKMNVSHPEAFNDEASTRAYVNELIAKSDRIQELAYCQNKVIDAILYHKLLIAKSNHMKTECEVIVPEDLKIDALDLMRLWTNLLDNAIEASIQLPQEQRYLRIKSHIRSGYLIIQIENSKPITNTVDLTSPRSTKPDKKFHGMGITIIQEVVNRYHGNITVGDFETSLVLNITLQNE